jgi:small-conductance mechanosensitive channel
MASPLDGLQALAERAEAELLAAVAAAPGIPVELWRVLPGSAAPVLSVLGNAASVCAAVLAVHLLVRHLVRRRRERAGAARSALAGMVALAGFELLPLAAAVVTGRVLLVRWLGIAPGTSGFTSDLTISLIRWLFSVTLTLIVLQPSVRRFRLAALDDTGARKAVRRVAILFAVGHAHIVLLNAAQRAGLGLPSVKLLSCLVACGMAAAAIRLLGALGRHGMPSVARFLASGLTLATLALWVWGWVALDFDLYRGAIGTIVVLLVALALDRAVAISIRDSRRPAMMRLLFVLRVVIDALAAAFVIRIVAEFWVMEAFGLFSAQEWPAFARRLSFASIVLVLAVTLVAVIHAWTEAKLTPPETGMTEQEREYRLARLSTVLPIIRFLAIGLIGVVFSLVALSAIGIDTTPLMAGAGIIGLAISFGSQTLVKDIVSGIFYMLDDVFRLGETIEAGSRQGRLEQINLRSVRLRDEAGRLHTVPLGDLGAVTNHSRRLVRVSVAVPLDALPGQAELVRFGRNAAAALRSEPMINAAIAGDIAVKLTEPVAAAEGAIAFSFNMAAATADRAQALVQRLVEEAVEEARMAAVSGTVSVSVADLPTAPSTPLQPLPAATAMAPLPQPMP